MENKNKNGGYKKGGVNGVISERYFNVLVLK
jgi:hypothetical protein